MSASEKHPIEAFENPTSKLGDEASAEFSPNSNEERMKVNLEPLHSQINTLTQMMNKLIQDNLARLNPRRVPAIVVYHLNLHLQNPPLESLVTAGYSPDTHCYLEEQITIFLNDSFRVILKNTFLYIL